MDNLIDKIGEIMIMYDGILNEFNITKLCSCFIEKNNKILDLCEIMVKKYSNILHKNTLNDFVLMIFLIYDKHTGPKNPDLCFKSIEKIVEDYSGELSETGIKIFMNVILNLHRTSK